MNQTILSKDLPLISAVALSIQNIFFRSKKLSKGKLVYYGQLLSAIPINSSPRLRLSFSRFPPKSVILAHFGHLTVSKSFSEEHPSTPHRRLLFQTLLFRY